MAEQSPLERAARALAESLERRPYGGYDYGHNEAFYGPAQYKGASPDHVAAYVKEHFGDN